MVRAQAASVQGAVVARHVSRMVENLSQHLFGVDGGLQCTVEASGLGSDEHLQLLSMQCSLLKLAAHMHVPFGGAHSAAVACWEVAVSARSVLVDCQSQFAGVFQASQTGTAAVGSDTAASPDQHGMGYSPTVVDGLPSLVLIGRCCFQWAAELYQLQQVLPDLGMRLWQLSSMGEVTALQVTEVLQVGRSHAAVAMCAKPASAAFMCLEGCQQSLMSCGVMHQLAAAGYPVEAVVQQLGATLSAMGALPGASDAGSAAAAYSDLVAQLQALGMVLNTLAVPHACNNPAFSNMAGPTELALVFGAQQCVRWLPDSALLQQDMSEAALEAAQAGVQGTGSSSSIQKLGALLCNCHMAWLDRGYSVTVFGMCLLCHLHA